MQLSNSRAVLQLNLIGRYTVIACAVLRIFLRKPVKRSAHTQMRQPVQIAFMAQLFAPVYVHRIVIIKADDIAHTLALQMEYSFVFLYPNRHFPAPSP
ncbi:hypothetical protein D3C80_1701890 [compost metagenome]